VLTVPGGTFAPVAAERFELRPHTGAQLVALLADGLEGDALLEALGDCEPDGTAETCDSLADLAEAIDRRSLFSAGTYALEDGDERSLDRDEVRELFDLIGERAITSRCAGCGAIEVGGGGWSLLVPLDEDAALAQLCPACGARERHSTRG
jgi:hypothetical protein